MKINTDKNCNIVIFDDTEYPINGIEYNLSVSLYIVLQNKSQGNNIIYSKIDLHTYNALPIILEAKQGGFYTICRIIIPKKPNSLEEETGPDIDYNCSYVKSANYITRQQIDELLELNLDNTLNLSNNQIYYLDNNLNSSSRTFVNKYYFDNGKVYFENLIGEVREVSYLELVEVNPNSTNLVVDFYNFFSVCYLRKCYVSLCLKIFNDRGFDRCFNGKVSSLLIYKRDLVWAALNVIQYMIDSNQLAEAQRLLERINGCNGLCSSEDTGEKGCGCEQ